MNLLYILINGETNYLTLNKETIMSTLKSLISQYDNRISNKVVLTTKYTEEVGEENFSQMVLLHKLDKHFGNDNARSCAIYIQMWLAEELGKLPKRAIEIAQKLKLKTDGKVEVGYPHSEGTYHYFD